MNFKFASWSGHDEFIEADNYEEAMAIWNSRGHNYKEIIYTMSLPEVDNVKDERIILSISLEEIDNAIELRELGDFYKNHPEAKAEALNCAHQRLSKYIDNNVYISDLIMEAVEDTASAYGFI